MEADLANNNDPNNNNNNNADFDVIDEIIAREMERQQQQQGQEHEDDLHEVNRTAEDILEADLEEVRQICPHVTEEVIRSRLMAAVANGTRVQYVINQLLDVEVVQDPDEVPQKKNKAGNGLKSKNRKRPDGGENEAAEAAVEAKKPKKDEEEDPQEGPSNKVKVTKDVSSSTSSVKAKKFIAITEDQMHGPFNFRAHRPEGGNNKASDPQQQQEENEVETIDISKVNFEEKAALMRQLEDMFPTTNKTYLREEAEKWAGNPAAVDKFITELLGRNSEPPPEWKPRVIDVDREAAAAAAVSPLEAEMKRQEEDDIEERVEMVRAMLPTVDPEFIHTEVTRLIQDDVALTRWIDQAFETKGQGLPTKADYERRLKEAELAQEYSREVTVEEILKQYDDPFTFFNDDKRQVSEAYKKLALAHLKKEHKTVGAATINKMFQQHNGRFYPAYNALVEYCRKGNRIGMRKTGRGIHECNIPAEQDLNFLKELQFCKIQNEVRAQIEAKQEERERRIEEARNMNLLMECKCCYEEHLEEEMLPCKNNHLYCFECVRRASEVAIGDGKVNLACLGECDENFELILLQKVLKADLFSKWLRKIQMAEVEEAGLEGLERCPFCEFATIMDRPPEEDKVFKCQNPECGEESCRLCKELNHIPARYVCAYLRVQYGL